MINDKSVDLPHSTASNRTSTKKTKATYDGGLQLTSAPTDAPKSGKQGTSERSSTQQFTFG